MSGSRIRVTKTIDMNRPGAKRHYLSKDGLWVDEERRSGRYRYVLRAAGQADPNDSKIIDAGNNLRALLRKAERADQ